MEYALHNHLGSKEDATARAPAHGVWLATGGKNGRSGEESRLSASIYGFLYVWSYHCYPTRTFLESFSLTGSNRHLAGE
jgi:hypothetical protein